MYDALVRTIFFPLHERLKGHPTTAALREARRVDRLSGDAIAAMQAEKLRRMLVHAATHTPHYRDAFAAAGVDPNDVRRTTDLLGVPLLERAALRADPDRFVATDRARRTTAIPTGGSTGEPVVVQVDRRRWAVNIAARLRAREWWGVRVGEREAVLWASPIEIDAQERLRAWRDRLLNTRLYSAFEGSDVGFERLVTDLAAYRPTHLYGYASSIHLVARHVLREAPDGRDFGLKAIFATAEGMSDEQRADVTRAFRAPVGGEYGARDAGLITHACPSGANHVLAEGMYVEILRPDGTPAAPGEKGEIVTTHLEAFGFPLIRYRTGDVGVVAEPGRCACGLALPRIERIEGRATDFLIAPDGRLLHALGAIYVLRVLPGVGRFQIEQPARDRLLVRVVREAGFPDDGATRIRDGLRDLMRHPVDVDVSFVEAIETSGSRKHRYVISPVAQAAIRGEGDD